MLPAVILISEITSDVGGVAAALAIGAFAGQAHPSAMKGSTVQRRRYTAVGGFIGMAAMIGIILLSKFGW